MSDDWTPEACTLPIADRPLRVAEFDDLFAHVMRSERPAPQLLMLAIPTEVEAMARALAERESACCSFFTFAFERVDGGVQMHIGVPADQIAVLDVIDARTR